MSTRLSFTQVSTLFHASGHWDVITYIHDIPHVVKQHDVDVQRGRDESRSLEQVFIVLLPCRRSLVALQRRRGEPAVLVDGDVA